MAILGVDVGGTFTDAVLLDGGEIRTAKVPTARAQAALQHTNARLVIYAVQPPTGDWNKYLRSLIVVREDPTRTGVFIAATDVTTLPAPMTARHPGERSG